MTPGDCIDADTAASYAAGSLPPAEVSALELHIDGCSSCRVLVSMVARSGVTSQDNTVGARPSTTAIMPKGTKVGRFEVLEPLDAGGMGLIYVAHDPKLDRRVALKAVRDRRADPAALPANVLVGDDGRVRVTDFGLARMQDDAHEEGLVRGTPAYLAPEQRDGKPPDALADQYSFCVSLHEALNGALPGQPATRSSGAPRAVARVIARGLETDPARRFPSMAALLTALRSARSFRTRWLALGAALVAAIAALAYLGGTAKAENAQCTELAAQLATPWNDTARDSVNGVFKHNALPSGAGAQARFEARLDAWNETFRAARQTACASHPFGRATAPDVLRSQLTCLTDAARDLKALLGVLQDADAAMITNADAFAEKLPSPERCTQPLPPLAPPPQGPEVEQLRDLFARTHALLDTGRYKQALPVARQADQAAQALGDPRLLARAKVALGSALARNSDPEGALAQLREGIRLAEISQADRARAQAWVTVLQVEFWRGHNAELLAQKDAAIGATERVGDEWLTTEAMLMAGGAYSQLDQLPQARALFEEAVRRRTRVFGAHDRRTSYALSSLGNALAMAGDLDGGIDAHQRAVDAAEAVVGTESPNVAILRSNLGDDFLYALMPGPAVRELEKAAAALEAANGIDQRDTANSVTDLGWAYLYANDPEKALATFERADAAWEKVMAKHPVHGMCLLGRQAALQRLGRAVSLEELERALKLVGGMPPFEKGRAQLALGEALAATDAARARALVKDSLAGLSTTTLPLIAEKKAEAQAWLDAHGDPK